jgi:diacylglycerol kinase family enzyme
MRRATLLFNPGAGGALNGRAVVEQCAEVLLAASVECAVVATSSAEDVTAQARAAVERGEDAVFACGGDGTMHFALQGLAGQTRTALGVVPMGSANVLARHLGLPMDAVEAMRAQIDFASRVLPVGRVSFSTRHGVGERFFLTVAGAGPDGMLAYRMLAGSKQRMGRFSYYVRAAWLFAQQRFAAFDVEADGVRVRAVSAMTVRVRDMGGIFSPLASGSLDAERLTLTLVKPPARLGLPAWFGLSWARMERWNWLAETREVASFRCVPHGHERVQVQADGEHLGRAPMEVSLVRDAVRLIVPGSFGSGGAIEEEL